MLPFGATFLSLSFVDHEIKLRRPPVLCFPDPLTLLPPPDKLFGFDSTVPDVPFWVRRSKLCWKNSVQMERVERIIQQSTMG